MGGEWRSCEDSEDSTCLSRRGIPPERRKLTASVCSEMCSKVVRKSIARVLTVINQNKKQAVREAYADKVSPTPQRYKPLISSWIDGFASEIPAHRLSSPQSGLRNVFLRTLGWSIWSKIARECG